jgi:hypothetical protein
MEKQKQKPPIQILVNELAELRDVKALKMLKKDLTRDISKEFLPYQDREAVDMIDIFLDEQNLRDKLTEIEKEF